jgi:hypothetical protein
MVNREPGKTRFSENLDRFDDGKRFDIPAINKAIEAAAVNSGGAVFFPVAAQ